MWLVQASDFIKKTPFFIDFVVFGRGVGDTIAPHEDDDSFGPLNLNVPVVYFGRQQTRLLVCDFII